MLWVFGIWIFSGCCMLDVEASPVLTVRILPRFAGTRLTYDTLTNTTASGQRVSITRLDFLLSDLALRTPSGVWYQQTNCFAYISGREERTSFVLSAVPA